MHSHRQFASRALPGNDQTFKESLQDTFQKLTQPSVEGALNEIRSTIAMVHRWCSHRLF